jgi:tetratricopeptide (TPR) repeat protein
MTVTAALIVRDEEPFIGDCLASLAGHVDQIVLVDTGSKDRTIEIARGFPVDLQQFPWTGDFSAARNRALDFARGEWILYIDADERLVVPAGESLPQLLSNGSKVAWKLRLYPRLGWTAYSELRLFRNDLRIRFEGVIHETMYPGVAAVAEADGLDVGTCQLALRHVGYEGDQRTKNPRNIPLLRARLARDPDSFFSWWHLGDCLRLAGDEDGAAATWSEGLARLRVNVPQPAPLSLGLLHVALLNLRRSRGEPLDDLLAEALAMFPDNLALQFLQARVAVDRGELTSARPILDRLVAIDADTFFEPELAYDRGLFGHLSAELLALCHFREGRFADAARLYRRAAQTSPSPENCEIKARLAEARARSR